MTGEGVLEVKLNDKGAVFDKLLNDLGICTERCIAIGNSFIDAPMVKKAGLGIAFNPADAKIKKVADVVIEEKDLNRICSVLNDHDYPIDE